MVMLRRSTSVPGALDGNVPKGAGRFGRVNAVGMTAAQTLAPVLRNCLIPWFEDWRGAGGWSG